jgi:hypothetical protein
MDLRIDRLRNQLIQKINATDDEAKLDILLANFDAPDLESDSIKDIDARNVERTKAALRSAKVDKLYSMEEVRQHFNIRGRK